MTVFNVRPVFLRAAVVAALAMTGCSKPEPEASADKPAAPSAPAAQASTADASSGFTGQGPLALSNALRFVEAPANGDVPTFVTSEMAKAAKDGRRVLVYVGATWCEPCQKFHHAADRGELDVQLGKLTLLQFDLDRDRDRLADAGYSSKFIPLFALPDASGLATDRRMEGSIKGEGAVAQIIPRLQALLADK